METQPVSTILAEQNIIVTLSHNKRIGFDVKTGEEISLTQLAKRLTALKPEWKDKEVLDALYVVEITKRERSNKVTCDVPPVIYFLPSKSKYYRKNSGNLWEGYLKEDIRLMLTTKYQMQDNDLDNYLVELQESQTIQDVGTLAGYQEGIHYFNGKKMLVTTSPTFIQSNKGTFPYITELLNQMLGDEQKHYFLGWLKTSILNLRGINEAGDYSSLGQAMFLVGKRSSCKTLLSDLVTDCLGGRHSDPTQYLLGDTTFNEHMFEAEHLIMDDKNGTDFDDKAQFSMNIKNIVVALSFYRHAKGMTPQQLPAKWRLTVLLNDDTNSLKIIPLYNQGMSDKITVFQVSKPDIKGIPVEVMQNRNALLQLFKAELPAFIHYLINEYEIPDAIKDPNYRFGVKAFINPAIMSQMTNPVHHTLLDLFDSYVVNSDSNDCVAIRATPGELVKLLKDCGVSMDKQYSTPSSMGYRLTDMEETGMQRISKEGRNYVISPSNLADKHTVVSLPHVLREMDLDKVRSTQTFTKEYQLALKIAVAKQEKRSHSNHRGNLLLNSFAA